MSACKHISPSDLGALRDGLLPPRSQDFPFSSFKRPPVHCTSVFKGSSKRLPTADSIQASTAFQSSLLMSARGAQRLPPNCSNLESIAFPHAQKCVYDLQPHRLPREQPCPMQDQEIAALQAYEHPLLKFITTAPWSRKQRASKGKLCRHF